MPLAAPKPISVISAWEKKYICNMVCVFRNIIGLFPNTMLLNRLNHDARGRGVFPSTDVPPIPSRCGIMAS